jgi:hypothetical protein
MMHKATLIGSQHMAHVPGEARREAILEIDRKVYCVVDNFSSWYDSRKGPYSGSVFDYEFSTVVDIEEPWEKIIRSDPCRRIGLEQIEGWRYRAYGKIVGVNPVEVDCGLFIENGLVQINTDDRSMIGKYVAFTIIQLGGHAYF